MEITIPQEDPVRLVSAQLEELDYRKLYRAYSSQGRKSAAEPRILFEVLVYGYLCGIYSTRKLEEACRKRVDFMWLLQGEPAPGYRSGRGLRESLQLPVSGTEWADQLHQAHQLRSTKDPKVQTADRTPGKYAV